MKNETEKLMAVSIALTEEQDRKKFLSMVLDVSMETAHCDGGTLYLLEEGVLRFTRMRTLSLHLRQGGDDEPISLPPVPMKPQYVCAWAALQRRMVNIPDVRQSEAYDFTGTIEYDRLTGYQTKSMLVVPLTGSKGETIGVMQLINAMDGEKVIPFTTEVEQIINALASQIAACIQNMRFAWQVEALMDSLVDAMTTAIDDRTAYNANHSRNMAKWAERFLDWAEKKDPSWVWTSDHRRAFILSVKLHDVGKLVTPLSVMNKESRLGELTGQVEERFRRWNLLDRIDCLEGRISHEELQERLETRHNALDRIQRMNRADKLDAADLQWTAELAQQSRMDENGKPETLLSRKEADCLLIQRGTLTKKERQMMEAHVTETACILQQVQFPPEYSEILHWTAAHHEYLDGTGYPNHLKGEQLPQEVRLLTILDIFESLMASDRPYKKAKTAGESMEILKRMAAQGKLDAGILELFEQSKVWETA